VWYNGNKRENNKSGEMVEMVKVTIKRNRKSYEVITNASEHNCNVALNRVAMGLHKTLAEALQHWGYEAETVNMPEGPVTFKKI
jgi:hypothetical protein